MGQIQNAFLQGLGIISQAAQMYRLTQPYIKGQKEKAAKEAAAKATQEAQVNYDYAKYKDKIIKGITEEQKAQWLKENERFETASAQERRLRRDFLKNTVNANLKVVKQKEIEHSNTNVMLQKVKEEIQRQKEINEKEGKKFEEYENEKKKSIYTIHNNLLNNNRSQQTITGKLSNILQINHNIKTVNI